jgi:hypothetical protein
MADVEGLLLHSDRHTMRNLGPSPVNLLFSGRRKRHNAGHTFETEPWGGTVLDSMPVNQVPHLHPGKEKFPRNPVAPQQFVTWLLWLGALNSHPRHLLE